MKKIIAASMALSLPACGAYEANGTGMINGKLADVSLIERANGISIAGYDLMIKGESLGLLALDEVSLSTASRTQLEFRPLETKYGTFDLSRTMVMSLVSAQQTFRLTLDGEIFATIQRSL